MRLAFGDNDRCAVIFLYSFTNSNTQNSSIYMHRKTEQFLLKGTFHLIISRPEKQKGVRAISAYLRQIFFKGFQALSEADGCQSKYYPIVAGPIIKQQ